MRTILAVLVLTLLGADAPKLIERPGAEAMKKNAALFQELFGADIARAKKPSEKAAIAKRLLGIAKETSDDEAGRLMLLVEARRLAVAGKDKRTAAEASQAIAERYVTAKGEPTDAKEQLRKAQELWDKATDAAGDGRLALQAEAVEWYARAQAGTLSGIERHVVERRMKEMMGEEPKRAAKSPLVGKWDVFSKKRLSCQWIISSDGDVMSNISKKPLKGKLVIDGENAKVIWQGKGHEGEWSSINLSDMTGTDCYGNKLRLLPHK